MRGLIAFRRQWLALSTAVLGLTASVTVLAFYLPLILSDLTDSQAAIGFGVGVEGLVALTVPLFVGRASDQRGRRIPYMLAATPLVVGGLLGVTLFDSYWALVGAVVAYFIGYYAYYTAYQSLYPDLVSQDEYGRAWSLLNIFQGVGVGLALLGGGVLIGINLSAPFLAAAGLFLLTTLVTTLLIRETGGRGKRPEFGRIGLLVRRLRSDRNLRLFLPAHFGWEFALAAIRAFVLLYLVDGLGLDGAAVAGILMVVIAAYMVAAIVSGNIVDRFDPRDYTAGAIVIFAASMLALGLTVNDITLLLVLPFGVFAAAAVLMLAYPILLRITPDDRHGEYTGYYQANRGLALILGTVGTGWLIDRFGQYFPTADGYQTFWLTGGVMVALTLPFFLRLTRKQA
ncbi:MAG TPA: MFS transporter [Patescibacteria group bacterium]|jgi:UMF1 family MFS transporter